MLTATTAFMETLEQWLQAAKRNDFDTAKHHAEFLVKAGELLIIHPNFTHCFTHHYPSVEPKQAMLLFCQMLVCATEGRALVLKQWVEQNRPANSRDPRPRD
jgi:hypothetical protein